MRNLTRFAVMLLLVPWTRAASPRLSPPAEGPIRVAVVVTEGATVIDFAGPWEVFQDTLRPPYGTPAFELYTVSDTTQPILASAGLILVPHYTFQNAPPPRVVVAGAQGGHSPGMLAWLRLQAQRADVLMSVCTGAAKLAAAGLLDGMTATTHHDFVEDFNRRFPQVRFVRSGRFVQSDPVILTSGGLTSGMDGALHIVERYYGRAVAQQTATYMEYQGTDW